MHGVQGQIKMDIDRRYEDAFEVLSVLFIEQASKKTPFFIENIDFNSGLHLVKLEEIDSKEAAQKLTNKPIFAREKDLPEIIEAEMTDDSIEQLIGYKIIDPEGKNIGTIEDIQEFPQQIMAFILYQGREVLIPLNNAFILDINPEKKEITMELPDGLLEV